MTNQFISKLCRLAPLEQADIADLAAATGGGRWVSARHDLIREGDRPGAVFVILEGWAIRYRILPTGTRQVLAFLVPGDACDLRIGLLAGMDHGIQTVTRARVATIGRTEMDVLFNRRPLVAKAMCVSQLIDAGMMRAWITSMGRRTSVERLAHLLCELYLRGKNVGLTTETHLEVPLSQSLLADALGMTAIHLNGVLKKLRLGKTISMKRGSITITDPLKLAQIAGFDENYLHRRLRPKS